jgi:hypothetical protein
MTQADTIEFYDVKFDQDAKRWTIEALNRWYKPVGEPTSVTTKGRAIEAVVALLAGTEEFVAAFIYKKDGSPHYVEFPSGPSSHMGFFERHQKSRKLEYAAVSVEMPEVAGIRIATRAQFKAICRELHENHFGEALTDWYRVVEKEGDHPYFDGKFECYGIDVDGDSFSLDYEEFANLHTPSSWLELTVYVLRVLADSLECLEDDMEAFYDFYAVEADLEMSAA